MSQLQQTVLRVQTNKPSSIIITGTTSMTFSGSTTGTTATGSGTSASPYVGNFPNSSVFFECEVTGSGTFYYDITLTNTQIGQNYLQMFIKHPGDEFFRTIFTSFAANNENYFLVRDGDIVAVKQGAGYAGGTFSVYFVDALQPEEVWILEKGDDGFLGLNGLVTIL